MVAGVFLAGGLAGCAGDPLSSAADRCRQGLDTAYKELQQADAEGFSAAKEYTKAMALLSAAKVQEEFGKYPNCIDKVNRARQYIRRARKLP